MNADIPVRVEILNPIRVPLRLPQGTSCGPRSNPADFFNVCAAKVSLCRVLLEIMGANQSKDDQGLENRIKSSIEIGKLTTSRIPA